MNRLAVLLFVFWFAFAYDSANSFTLDKPILYTGKEPGLIIVDHKSLQPTIHNRSQLIMFEFYNSWCGHCVRFAPIWKQLANDVRRWNSTVLLTALDCAEESNAEVCRDYDVMMYPSIRFFYPFVNSSNEHGKQLEELKPDANYLKGLIVNSLIEYQSNHSTPTWPNLQPIVNLTQWHQIREATFSSQKKANLQLFAIIEPPNSLLGSEIILELSNYADFVRMYRISNNNTELLSSLIPEGEMISNVTLIAFENKDFLKAKVVRMNKEKVEAGDFLELLNDQYLNDQLFKEERQPTSTEKPSVNKSISNEADNQLQVSDLYGALQFTLFNQIPLKSSLNSTQLLVFQRFLRVVHNYFPFDQSEPQQLISHLLNATLKHTHSLPISQYLSDLNSFNYNFNDRFVNWKTCRGSSPNFRGYPCSLWSLFHTLTVREYVKAQRDQKWVNLHEVLFTMRDYIANFFTCSHCASHFSSMAVNLEQQLQQPNASVLWLWKAHNIVNHRLSGDLTEDPHHPKQQYPTKTECSSCWLLEKPTTSTVATVTSNTTVALVPNLINDLNNPFNETSVLEFLLNRYTLDLPPYVPPSYSAEFSALQSESGVQTVPRRMLFDYTDISICFALYFMTTILLFTIFFVLRMRNRRKHSKYSKKMLPFGDL